MAPITVVFDLDGTLVDTAPDLAATTNALLARHGRTVLPVDSVRGFAGRGARVMMERAFAATGTPASEPQLDALYDEFIAHYLDNLDCESRPYPGVRETLEALAGEGAGMGICTNKPEAATHRLLAALGLDRYFAGVVGGDTLAVRKPHPEHVLEAARRAGGAETAVMVGDTANDVQAARAARIPVIAVSFGYADPPLSAHEVDHLIDDFSELAGCLARLRARPAPA